MSTLHAELPRNLSFTFLNLYTQRTLAQVEIPARPAAGDFVYLDERGYEVANLEWRFQKGVLEDVLVHLRPQLDEAGERPFQYPEEDSP